MIRAMDAPLPEGLEVRPACAEHIRAIWDAQQKARRDHWGYRLPTEQDFHRWTTGRLFAPELWQKDGLQCGNWASL